MLLQSACHLQKVVTLFRTVMICVIKPRVLSRCLCHHFLALGRLLCLRALNQSSRGCVNIILDPRSGWGTVTCFSWRGNHGRVSQRGFGGQGWYWRTPSFLGVLALKEGITAGAASPVSGLYVEARQYPCLSTQSGVFWQKSAKGLRFSCSYAFFVA